MESKKINIFSGFVLKIIALVTMTFDHIGIFIVDPEVSQVFRSIGRLAFPIFIFLLVEGVRHTRNFWKYFLRISILALIIMIGTIGATVFVDPTFTFSSPIIDLVVISLMIYLINRKDKLSFLAILPGAYLILCFAVGVIEINTQKQITLLPYFLRADYTIYGLLLSLGFYFAKPLSILFLSSRDETKNLTVTPFQRISENLICVLAVLIGTFIYCVISFSSGINFEIQAYAVIAAIPLLFYSGTRGYNAKWFQYGSYLYFPLHLVIIYGIFALL